MLDLVQSPQTLAQGATLLFALVIGHALADYPLQGDFLALHKNRHYKDPSRKLPSGIWFHCLIAHGLIHAGFVWVISGRVILGVAELVLHVGLDFIKSDGRTSYHTDQALHIISKAIFVLAIMKGWV
jgi:hypothetical protein